MFGIKNFHFTNLIYYFIVIIFNSSNEIFVILEFNDCFVVRKVIYTHIYVDILVNDLKELLIPCQ